MCRGRCRLLHCRPCSWLCVRVCGGRVLSLLWTPCGGSGCRRRLDHLSSVELSRVRVQHPRNSFSFYTKQLSKPRKTPAERRGRHPRTRKLAAFYLQSCVSEWPTIAVSGRRLGAIPSSSGRVHDGPWPRVARRAPAPAPVRLSRRWPRLQHGRRRPDGAPVTSGHLVDERRHLMRAAHLAEGLQTHDLPREPRVEAEEIGVSRREPIGCRRFQHAGSDDGARHPGSLPCRLRP